MGLLDHRQRGNSQTDPAACAGHEGGLACEMAFMMPAVKRFMSSTHGPVNTPIAPV